MELFAWDDANREHVAKHRVTRAEAEEVIRGARFPYPMEIADGKVIVWGATSAGRYLQVIFVIKRPEEVEYECLTAEDWMAVEAGDVSRIVRVIHAMDLTADMKRRLRKRRR